MSLLWDEIKKKEVKLDVHNKAPDIIPVKLAHGIYRVVLGYVSMLLWLQRQFNVTKLDWHVELKPYCNFQKETQEQKIKKKS